MHRRSFRDARGDPRPGDDRSAGQNPFTERRFPYHYPTDDDRRRPDPSPGWTARGSIEPEVPQRFLLFCLLARHSHWNASKNPKPSTMFCAISIRSSTGPKKHRTPSVTSLSYTGGSLAPFETPSTTERSPTGPVQSGST